jgi:hypothetical protein
MGLVLAAMMGTAGAIGGWVGQGLLAGFMGAAGPLGLLASVIEGIFFGVFFGLLLWVNRPESSQAAKRASLLIAWPLLIVYSWASYGWLTTVRLIALVTVLASFFIGLAYWVRKRWPGITNQFGRLKRNQVS